MKIIHTGDWHIGKLVHQIHMTEDQRHILNQFVELVKEEKPDAIVIAGDLYDRSVPPVEAVELLDEIFTKILLDFNTPILAIAGNHDSPDRLGFGSSILRHRGLHIEGRLKDKITPIVLKDEHGPVNFYLLPYADPAIIRDITKYEEIHNHDDAMGYLLKNIKESMNRDERNVLVAHSFVIGVEDVIRSDSERPLSIGGTEFVDVNHFKDFDYVALGHLHGPQRVHFEKVRYSGSLMRYSFSECKQSKSVTIVNMDDKGEISIECKSLKPLRDMRRIQGKLEELLKPESYKDANIEDYLMVLLEDKGEIIDPIGKLRTVYPNVLRVDRVEETRLNESHNTSAGKDHNKKSKVDLFREFYSNMTGEEFTEDMVGLMIDILKDMEKEEERA